MALEQPFDDVSSQADVGLVLVPDSAGLLAFHWSYTQGRFLDDFYNVGITRA